MGELLDRLVRIEYDGGGNSSGIIVSNQGLILSAYHNFFSKNGPRLPKTLWIPNGKSWIDIKYNDMNVETYFKPAKEFEEETDQYDATKTYKTLKMLDLFLIRVKHQKFSFPALKICTTSIENDSLEYLVYNHSIRNKMLQVGKVINIAPATDSTPQHVTFLASCLSGFSGGGVFKDGKLLGTITKLPDSTFWVNGNNKGGNYVQATLLYHEIIADVIKRENPVEEDPHQEELNAQKSLPSISIDQKVSTTKAHKEELVPDSTKNDLTLEEVNLKLTGSQQLSLRKAMVNSLGRIRDLQDLLLSSPIEKDITVVIPNDPELLKIIRGESYLLTEEKKENICDEVINYFERKDEVRILISAYQSKLPNHQDFQERYNLLKISPPKQKNIQEQINETQEPTNIQNQRESFTRNKSSSNNAKSLNKEEMHKPKFPIPAIRKTLETLDDETLVGFCWDYLSDTAIDFADQMTRPAKINFIFQRCLTEEKQKRLLEAITEDERTSQEFAKHFRD